MRWGLALRSSRLSSLSLFSHIQPTDRDITSLAAQAIEFAIEGALFLFFNPISLEEETSVWISSHETALSSG